jgi:CheY-like chemotaxis protein
MTSKPLNVLLIDDDEVDVMTVRRAFKKNGIAFTLATASDGIEGLAVLRGESEEKLPVHNRLVLLDLNMPRMNGIEFLEELRANPELKSTPVIVLTTSNEDQDKVEAYNFNVAGYILKPVTFSKFVSTVKTLKDYWLLNEMP